MISFKKIELKDKDIFDKYCFPYGENSCQHSFISSFCLLCKYDDMYFEDGNFLYIYRNGRSNDKERVYLFPIGDTNDKRLLKDAISMILDDAKENVAKAIFNTVTLKCKEILEELFPDKFTIEECRDYFEYIYDKNSLANLEGHHFVTKRYDVKSFFKEYDGRIEERLIDIDKDIDIIKSFQKKWLEEKMIDDENDPDLEYENIAIDLALSNYKSLSLNGIIIFIDGNVAGFACGYPLSDKCFDVHMEKGDKNYLGIYKVLNRDLVRMCCNDYQYVNREEDVGVPGLRWVKESYRPVVLLEKYIAKEN